MMRRFLCWGLLAVLLVLILAAGQTSSAASFAVTKTPLATRTPSRTATSKPSLTPSATFTPSATPLPPKGQLYAIQWSPDGKALYVLSSSGLWHYTSNFWGKPPVLTAPIAAFGPPSINDNEPMNYAIANELVATAGLDAVVRLWGPDDGLLKNKLPPFPAAVNRLGFSPDGSLLIVGTNDDAVNVWDLDTNTLMAKLPGTLGTLNNQPAPFFFSSDSQTMIYLTSAGEIVEWLRQANLIRSTTEHGASFIASRDGHLLAIPNGAAFSDNTAVDVFDVEANTLVGTFKSDGAFSLMTFSPDGKSLYALSDGHFWHWSIADETQSTPIRLVDTRDQESGLSYNPARNVLARVSQFGFTSESDPFLEVRVQNMLSGSSALFPAKVTNWGQQQVTPVAFSPDGSTLAVAGHNGVQLWTVDGGQTVAILGGYADVPN